MAQFTKENHTFDPNTKVKVTNVNVAGVERTKKYVIGHFVKNIFNAETLEQLNTNAQEMTFKMNTLQLFKDIQCSFINNTTSNAPGAIDVNIFVKEREKYMPTGSIMQTFGNDGAFNINGTLPNLYGAGELAQLNLKYGLKNKTMGYNLSYLKPLFINGDPKYTLNHFLMTTDHPFSGINQQDKGFSNEISFNTANSMKHILRWEAVWRNLSSTTPETALEIKNDCGHSIKSAIQHEFVYDNRNSPIFPTKGMLFKCVQEIAGLGGNVKHLKHEFQFQTNKLLLDTLTFQTTFRAGILNNFNTGKSLVCDKFFLGGPLSIRGFEVNGIGPQNNGFFLGASSYWSAGLQCYTRLPFVAKDSVINDKARLHAFANAGNIGNFTSSKNLHSLVENTRCSVGFGVAVNLGNAAKLEVNYTIPYSYQKTDKLNPGLQVGIGFDFL